MHKHCNLYLLYGHSLYTANHSVLARTHIVYIYIWLSRLYTRTYKLLFFTRIQRIVFWVSDNDFVWFVALERVCRNSRGVTMMRLLYYSIVIWNSNFCSASKVWLRIATLFSLIALYTTCIILYTIGWEIRNST